jgi:hypothetical protein
MAERWQTRAIFQAPGRHRRGNLMPIPTGCFKKRGQPAPMCRRRRAMTGSPGAGSGANYPLPDAVVDVIDRLVDATV